MYFTPFVAMVSGIVSLISLSDFSLLVYRNARAFYALILYPATLPNSLINSNSFLMSSLGFSMYSIINAHRQFYFFANLHSFYFFFFTDCHARTSKTMLSNSGKSGHPCLIPDLRGNAYSFSLLIMMLWVCHICP